VASQVFTGRYQMVRQVARGGMAEVYLARDLLLDRPVALKVLFPEFSTDPSFVERFRREARAAANLNHPGIVSIYDWGQEGRTYFIVMEYVDGRTLREVIRAEGPLLAHRAAEIGADIAGALHFAHQHDCVHRDVKPGNVMISGQQVKVTDFGIARAGDSGGENLTQTGAVMGTATYFSPEQAQGYDVDARSDVYSLGVVLYEMVTGRPPFKGDNPVAIAYQHVREQPVPPSEINADVPRVFDAIILKAMAKDTTERYQSAEALRLDLLRYANGQPVSVEPVGATSVGRVAARPTPVAPAAAVTGIIPRTPGGYNGSRVDGTRIAGPAERVQEEYIEPPRQRTGIYIGILVTLLVILGGLLYLLSRELGVGGNAQIAMPTVIGKTESEANSILRDAGLKVTRREEANEANDAGKVIKQNPDPGAQVKKGSEVIITVSQGAPSATIPDVRGRGVDLATSALEDAGFVVRTVRRTDTAAAVDTVIDQDPKPGPGKRGGTITLTVSNGAEQVRVPEVRGRPEGEAANILGQAGFKTQTRVETSTTVDAGVVIRTEPDSTTRLDKGETVTLIVSSGPPATIPQPDTTLPPVVTTFPPFTIFPTTTVTTEPPTSTTI
jgi:serine/threonine-protein kinase